MYHGIKSGMSGCLIIYDVQKKNAKNIEIKLF